MTEGTTMKSIDRLREYVCSAPMTSMTNVARSIVVGMTDEIEREVKELTDERDLLKTQWEAGVDFDQRLAAAAEGRIDVTLFGVDYTALPLDADGVPIHVGDRVQLIGNDPSTVSHMSLAGDGWRVYVKYDGGLGTGSGEPSRIRHHHAPTVDDVLREFGKRWDDPAHYAKGELVEEYAAKLQLKEG